MSNAVVPHKGHSTKAEMIRRLRLANLRKLLRERCGHTLPDDDAGREYLFELLLPISVGPHADIKMPNAIEVWAPWMQKDEATQIIDHINRMPIWERKPKARELGERLRVINPERERLKLWTIAPCDMSQKGMTWWRKHKDKARKRRLRQLSGAKSQTTSTSRSKPWTQLGISRASWYRRRETTSSEVKLTSTEDKLVSLEKRQVSKEGVAVEWRLPVRPETSLKKEEKAEMPVTDTAREFSGQSCLTREEQSSTDLRGMPADLSKFYPATPSYEWLNPPAKSDRAAA